MAVKRNGLGKGLDSLIPNKTVKKTENKIAHQTIHMGGKAASCVILPLMKKQ